MPKLLVCVPQLLRNLRIVFRTCASVLLTQISPLLRSFSYLRLHSFAVVCALLLHPSAERPYLRISDNFWLECEEGLRNLGVFLG